MLKINVGTKVRSLFKRLHSQFGIKDTALSWMISYLSVRSESFTANSTVAAESKVTMGVPQGSVLGPLLYTLYTSGIWRITDKLKTPILLYSDDSQLYMVFKASCQQEAQSTLRLEAWIDEVNNWLIHSRLQLNPVKSEFLVVVPPRLERSLAVPGLRVRDTMITPLSRSETYAQLWTSTSWLISAKSAAVVTSI